MAHNLTSAQGSTRVFREMESSSVTVQSLVCNACWQGPFSEDSFRRSSEGHLVFHATTWGQIQESADQGCTLCGFFVSDRDDAKSNDPVKVGIAVGSMNEGQVTPAGVQYIEFKVDGHDVGNNGCFIYTCADDPAASDIVARRPIPQVGSPLAYRLALQCLEDCFNNHTACPKPTLDTRLPTRVIDCSDPTRPRLFISGSSCGEYVALSYVWGEEQTYATHEDNLDTYIAGISYDRIPQTIRDAIEATHTFGMRYLWVDAFCIIQDSSEDKRREIRKMRGIFHDAYLTIIAASAPSASAGFLRDRLPPTHARLPFRCRDGRLGTVSLVPMWERYDGNADPVNQRAWCLEERLLSPRRLVYASDTLQYHCRTSMSAIGGALVEVRTAEQLPTVLFLSDTEIAAWLSRATRPARREVRWAWMDVLRNYTRRSLTDPDDKLVAVGGVSEQFHRIWNKGRYLAGLWEETLTYDLLWFSDPDVDLRPRPLKYLAPTWSWASVHTPVAGARGLEQAIDPLFRDGVCACNVLHCDVVLKDDKFPFGRVVAGVLKLRVVMLKTIWKPSTSESKIFVNEQDCGRGDLHVLESGAQDAVCVGMANVDTSDDFGTEKEVWAIPIRWNVQSPHTYAAGLFVTLAESHQFRRIGYWESPHPERDESDDARDITLRLEGPDVRWQSIEIV